MITEMMGKMQLFELGVVKNTCNPSIHETEAGGLQVSGQSKLHKQDLFPKKIKDGGCRVLA
jgi:hypothetical protein